MKLLTLREFPTCVRPIELAAGDGADPRSQFLALTQDQLFEFFYRMRRFRLVVDMKLTTPEQGEQEFRFSSPPEGSPGHDNHRYNSDATGFEPPSDAPASELDLVCLSNTGGPSLTTQTPTNENQTLREPGNPDHGKAIGYAWTLFFGSHLYWDRAADLYYWDFLASVSLTVASTVTKLGGTAHLFFRSQADGAPDMGEDAPPAPTLSLPWGQVLQMGAAPLLSEGAKVEGTAALVFEEWWPYANADGSEPWWNSATGAPIAPNPRALT